MPFDFGSIPESARKRPPTSPIKPQVSDDSKEASLTAKSGKASWVKLYQRLLGPEKGKENEEPGIDKSSEEDTVTWMAASSSSPIAPPHNPQSNENIQSTAFGTIPDMDPAVELFEKYRSMPGSSPPSTWPLPQDTPSRKLRKTGSEKTIRTPSRGNHKGMNEAQRYQLYSPEFLKKSFGAGDLTKRGCNSGGDLGHITIKENLNNSDNCSQSYGIKKDHCIQESNDKENTDVAQHIATSTSHSPPTSPPQIANLLNSDDFQTDDSDFEQLEQLLKTTENSKEYISPPNLADQSKSYDKNIASNDYDGFGDSEDSEDSEEWNLIDKMLVDKEQNSASNLTSVISDVSLTTTITKPNLHRYSIRHVEKNLYLNDKLHRELTQLELIVSTSDGSLKTILLRDSWSSQTLEPGNIIHIIGEYDDTKQSEIILTNENFLLIVNPDRLITCTNIADSFNCQRKVVLRDRIRPAGESNKFIIYGCILHDVFEDALASGDFSEITLKTNITHLVRDVYDEDITLLKLLQQEVLDELFGRIPALQQWQSLYYNPTPSQYSAVKVHSRGSAVKTLMSISKVIDIEEEIWSPMFGIKGKIDATVQTTVLTAKSNGVYLAPFEIKASKNTTNIQHRAQALLYTLLLSDRYDIPISFAVLCYCLNGEMFQIASVWDETRSLIQGRNEIARYLKSTELLPPVIRDSFMCGRCEWKDICMTYHKVEGGTSESSGVEDFIELTDGLSDNHIQFFKHWDSLLAKETGDIFRHLREIWTMTSKEREKVGRALGNMKIVDLQRLDRTGSLSNIGRYIYVMTQDESTSGSIDYSASDISPGDMIIVSDEFGHVCLASGTVFAISDKSITISINRPLTSSVTDTTEHYDERSSQIFQSRLVNDSDAAAQTICNKTFRIDKNEVGQSMAIARNNLAQLFVSDGDLLRRELVVDLKPPKFSKVLLPPNLKNDDFNVDQLSAIQKVLSAEDYALILGMPGTGKTTTIAAIIQLLVSQGKTILLASHTHSAVDNILMKIKDKGFSIARLGSPSKIHYDVRNLSTTNKKNNGEEDLHSIYLDPPVVATTCLGINHWLFGQRQFDYCIVDEASQLTLPSCLGPLRFADRFVLVGDHFQLSPLIKNPEAQSGGLDQSLFKILCEKHPQAVVNLTHQYRMNEDIMLLSNGLIYNGQLKCGSEEVRKRALKIPRRNAIESWKKHNLEPSDDWLTNVLNG